MRKVKHGVRIRELIAIFVSPSKFDNSVLGPFTDAKARTFDLIEFLSHRSFRGHVRGTECNTVRLSGKQRHHPRSEDDLLCRSPRKAEGRTKQGYLSDTNLDGCLRVCLRVFPTTGPRVASRTNVGSIRSVARGAVALRNGPRIHLRGVCTLLHLVCGGGSFDPSSGQLEFGFVHDAFGIRS